MEAPEEPGDSYANAHPPQVCPQHHSLNQDQTQHGDTSLLWKERGHLQPVLLGLCCRHHRPHPCPTLELGSGRAKHTAGRRAQHLGLLLCPSAGSMEEAQRQKGRCSGSRLQGKRVKKIPW